MTGDLWSDGDVQVDGQLCGNIYCAQLIVGKDAVVTGAIIAQEAVIRGRMIGIIRAMRVLLQDTARVESEIFYRSLSIEEGARFEGVASPRLDPLDLNPLDEDIGVSPMAELRQSVARVGAGTPNGAAPGAVAAYRLADGSALEEWGPYEIAGTLRGAVRTMLLAVRGLRRVREVAK